MRILRDFAQQTNEWFDEHLARATASSAAAILDFTQKGVEGSTRRSYRLLKVAESLSGIAVHPNYVSAPMLAGNAAEPHARTHHELEENVMVEPVGIVIGDDERTAWSPDGVVTDDAGNIIGAVELKGPQTTTHLKTLDAIAQAVYPIPEENQPQLWFAFMVCPTLQWIDFSMRDGGMETDKLKIKDAIGNGIDLSILPRRYKQFTYRLERSQCLDKIAKMRAETDRFLADVDATIARINSICPELPDDDAPIMSELTDEQESALGISDDDIRAIDPSWQA